MSVFWLIAAAMVLLALAFLLPSLLRKGREKASSLKELNIALYQGRLGELTRDLKTGVLSEAQFAAAKSDLEKELLYDLSGSADDAALKNWQSGRWAAGVVAVLVPLLALGLYLELGASKLVPVLQAESAKQAQAASPHDTPQGNQAATQGATASVEELLAGLVERLKANPDDAKGWQMLAKSYVFLRRYGEAVEAYAQVYRLVGDNPDVLTDYAEAIALADRNELTGRSAKLLDRTLELRPNHRKAAWLRGFAHYQLGEFAQALQKWESLAAVFPENSEERRQIAESIRAVKNQMGVAVEEPRSGTGAAATSAGGKAEPGETDPTALTPESITVRVELDAALAEQTSPDDTVFIFARAMQGPRMPLAIQKKQVRDLPFTVTLDDTMAMTPAIALSQFPQVVVGARVSKSGNAMPQSGDLQGSVSPVAPGVKEIVQLRIDSLMP